MIAYCQDLNKYFKESDIEGSISIYDLKNQTWKHSDESRAKEGSLPASTFKIIHTMIGLEEQVIDGIHDTIRWDGKDKMFKNYKITNWNQDTDLAMAFKNSTVWYYEEIAKQIKKRKYCRYLRKSKYSDKNLSSPREYDFWNFGALKVSPIEQIELLIKLYSEELPFSIAHQRLTKELMLENVADDYIIRSKTGWSYDTQDVGWYVGYIELSENVVFFATRIEKPLTEEKVDFSKLRKSITKQIISDLYEMEIK